MPKFEICLAFDVSCYRTVEVEAATKEQAIERAKTKAQDMGFNIEWDTATDYRVVDVITPNPEQSQ